MNVVLRVNRLAEQLADLGGRLDALNTHSAENAVQLYNAIVEHMARARSEISELRESVTAAILDVDEASKLRGRQLELDQQVKKLTVRVLALANDVASFRPAVESAQVLARLTADQHQYSQSQLYILERLVDRLDVISARLGDLERRGFWRRLWRWLYSRRGS